MLIVKSFADLMITVVSTVCTVLYWILIIRIILSWVGINPYTNFHPLLNAIYQVSDAVLIPFRRIPLRIGMMDFTPIIAIILLSYIPILLHAILYTLMGLA
jgi:YggT family protein